MAHANKGQRQAVLAMINTIFAQETPDAARAQWRAIADQLREKLPKLAAMMDEAEHEVLAFMGFPRAHRAQIHSTNPLERLNAGVKRRTNVVGIFPNERAIIRLVGAMMIEQNDEWSLQRRYMQLEGLQSLSESQPAAVRRHQLTGRPNLPGITTHTPLPGTLSRGTASAHNPGNFFLFFSRPGLAPSPILIRPCLQVDAYQFPSAASEQQLLT